MNTGRRIVKNTISLLVSGILGQLLLFATSIYLARVLGAEDFGKINFAMAFVVYFTLTANMGLPLLGTREIARDVERIHDYVRSILSLRLVLALASFALLVFVTAILDESSDTKHLIILYGVGLIPSALLLDWVFQGIEKMEYIGVGRLLSLAAYAVLMFVYVKTSKQILLVPCLQIVSSILYIGALFFVLHTIGSAGDKGRAKIPWKHLLTRAFPIGMMSILSAVIYYLDTVMLGFMKTNIEVGLYNAAYKIILLLIMGTATYHDSIFPILTSLHKTSFESLGRLHYFTLKLMVASAIPLSVGGMILADKIIILFYGEKYTGAVIAFKILLVACSLIFINTAYTRILLATGKDKSCLYIFGAHGAIAVILNFVLIPPFGLVGAATATVLGELFSLIVYYKLNNRMFKFRISGNILKSFAASLLMGVVLFLCADWNLFVLVFLGIVIYSAAFYLLKGTTMEEIESIRSVIVKT